jgi:hypothetical protein
MTTVAKLLEAFDREWRHWGRSTWNLATGAEAIGGSDDDATLARYVIERYCPVVDDSPTISAIRDDEYYWSAAGMCAAFKEAGFKNPSSRSQARTRPGYDHSSRPARRG